jgi:N-acetylglucosamine-6-sulfatase
MDETQSRYPRRLLLAVAVFGSLIGMFALRSFNSTSEPLEAQEVQRPNFVFILADDMRKNELKYMPKTRSLLKAKGMSFANASVSNALCCPSRATIMRGQYAHNTGVWTNAGGSAGGWEGYRTNGHERDNVATRLDAAGYRTALIGKYLNNDYKNTRYVPPGWDKWFATFTFEYFNYDVNANGTIRHFSTNKEAYLTDVLRRQTVEFIGASASSGQPFFAYVAPIAPHMPATPAPRHVHAYDGAKAPRLPSFNEANVSDKPRWIRQLPRLSDSKKKAINGRHEKRVESLQALDGLVEAVVNKLRNSGQLSNTYIFFTSDNGVHQGEHRVPVDKGRPYEEDVRMPLLVRGPGVAGGSTAHKLALNTDYFPTFTDLANIQTPNYVDGRSLRPLLRGNATTWRSAVLLEARRTPNGGATPAYYGIRTSDGRKYIEYNGGRRELYNLGADPYELRNSYNAAAPPSVLATRLRALKACAGTSCRSAENAQ